MDLAAVHDRGGVVAEENAVNLGLVAVGVPDLGARAELDGAVLRNDTVGGIVSAVADLDGAGLEHQLTVSGVQPDAPAAGDTAVAAAGVLQGQGGVVDVHAGPDELAVQIEGQVAGDLLIGIRRSLAGEHLDGVRAGVAVGSRDGVRQGREVHAVVQNSDHGSGDGVGRGVDELHAFVLQLGQRAVIEQFVFIRPAGEGVDAAGVVGLHKQVGVLGQSGISGGLARGEGLVVQNRSIPVLEDDGGIGQRGGEEPGLIEIRAADGADLLLHAGVLHAGLAGVGDHPGLGVRDGINILGFGRLADGAGVGADSAGRAGRRHAVHPGPLAPIVAVGPDLFGLVVIAAGAVEDLGRAFRAGGRHVVQPGLFDVVAEGSGVDSVGTAAGALPNGVALRGAGGSNHLLFSGEDMRFLAAEDTIAAGAADLVVESSSRFVLRILRIRRAVRFIQMGAADGAQMVVLAARGAPGIGGNVIANGAGLVFALLFAADGAHEQVVAAVAAVGRNRFGGQLGPGVSSEGEIFRTGVFRIDHAREVPNASHVAGGCSLGGGYIDLGVGVIGGGVPSDRLQSVNHILVAVAIYVHGVLQEAQVSRLAAAIAEDQPVIVHSGLVDPVNEVGVAVLGGAALGQRHAGPIGVLLGIVRAVPGVEVQVVVLVRVDNVDVDILMNKRGDWFRLGLRLQHGITGLRSKRRSVGADAGSGVAGLGGHFGSDGGVRFEHMLVIAGAGCGRSAGSNANPLIGNFAPEMASGRIPFHCLNYLRIQTGIRGVASICTGGICHSGGISGPDIVLLGRSQLPVLSLIIVELINDPIIIAGISNVVNIAGLLVIYTPRPSIITILVQKQEPSNLCLVQIKAVIGLKRISTGISVITFFENADISRCNANFPHRVDTAPTMEVDIFCTNRSFINDVNMNDVVIRCRLSRSLEADCREEAKYHDECQEPSQCLFESHSKNPPLQKIMNAFHVVRCSVRPFSLHHLRCRARAFRLPA